MQLRSRKIASPGPADPQRRAPTGPRAQPKGKQPARVTKSKAPPKRKGGGKKKAPASKTPTRKPNARTSRSPSPRRRWSPSGSDSSSALSSIDSDELAKRLDSDDNDKTIPKFWLKPYLKTYSSRDALAPRATGVQKVKHWGPHALLPFGKPFWRRRKREGRLEMLLPMLVTEEQKKNADFQERWGGWFGKMVVKWDTEENGEDDDEDVASDNGDDDENGGDDGGVGDAPGPATSNDGYDLYSVSSDESDSYDDDGARQDTEGHAGDQQDLNSPESPDSEIPPYSINYPLDRDRHANPPTRDIEPRSYDVVELGPEFDGLEEESRMEDAAFLRSHHGYEAGWVGKRIIGTGEEGRAGLWEKLDDAGTNIDVSTRLKDCNLQALLLIPTIPLSKSASSRRETFTTINCENHLK
ncbi:MAG: hypothetical protein Q9171_003783 [Xanthocarpia ochracea]